MNEIEIITVNGEESISTPVTKVELANYSDIEPQIAWEFANLIRIAATDFQYFGDWFSEGRVAENEKFILETTRELDGVKTNQSWIYAERKIAGSILEKYTILSEQEAELEESKEKFPDSDFYKYKIRKTYEFISYYPHKFEVDIDRFGFIAERQIGDKRLVFVIFRGTRELSEWFNNSQFKQINFLSTKENTDGFPHLGKVSIGFNKMYTSFRPGIWLENEQNNALSQTISEKIRNLIEKRRGFDIEEKSIRQVIAEFFSTELTETTSNTHIYVAGHSLGGALATLAAMDIVATDLNLTGESGGSKLTHPVNLHTFASPRVGDNLFADKFNELMVSNHIKAFRFANSEDLVAKIPLPVWLKMGTDLSAEKWSLLSGLRDTFNTITGGIFETDYQHVGIPIYFTHQARRKQSNGELNKTSNVGDNHNLTASYCGALPPIHD